jgi:hypothetical protein
MHTVCSNTNTSNTNDKDADDIDDRVDFESCGTAGVLPLVVTVNDIVSCLLVNMFSFEWTGLGIFTRSSLVNVDCDFLFNVAVGTQRRVKFSCIRCGGDRQN